MGLAVSRLVPSLDHEAPLVVLREQPALVPTLLRDVLGVPLPPFATAELGDAGFTQAMPAELRADLVVHLRGEGPERAPVMAVVVEVQRARDDDKLWSWPLYLAALHARSRCPSCLIVIATDDATARWAARPIMTWQPGSPFVPLVLGPEQFPRVELEQAHDQPWMAILSALVHGNRPGGTATTLAAFEAMSVLPEPQARVCYDLLRSSLNEAARRALEEEMDPGKYRFKSDHAKLHFGEGWKQGQEEGRQEGRSEAARELVLTLADRYGAVTSELRARVEACGDPDQLRSLAIDLAGAGDRAAVESVLARLPAG